MAWGRRCDIGCETWPDDDRYEECVHCGEPTTRFRNLRPIPEDEAELVVSYLKFEEYYADHCSQHGVSVDGPL